MEKKKDLKKQIDNMKNFNEQLLRANQKLNVKLSNPTKGINFAEGLTASNFSLLDNNALNYENKLNARLSQLPSYNPSCQAENDNKQFIVYQMVLEKARYFKNRILWKCENLGLEFLLYEMLYYAALNGQVALIKDNGLFYLGQVIEKKYNKYGELLKCRVKPINIYGGDDFNYNDKNIDVDNVIIYQFNNECFGLWVTAYWYLKDILNYLELLNTQTFFLNKKLILILKDEYQMTEDIISQIMSTSPLINLNDDLIELKKLELPEVVESSNQLWNTIIRLSDWYDYHLLGIRTSDLAADNTTREITANAGNQSQYIEKIEQGYNFYVAKFCYEIFKKWKIKVEWKDLNINFSNTLKNDGNNKDKINVGNEGNND